MITLPWPPTVNTYWRHWQGRVVISAVGKRYRQAVGYLCLAAGVRLSEGRLSVEIQAFPPDERKRDIDNILKAPLDALQGMCYRDDSQIDRLTVIRRNVFPQGKLEVSIQEIP